MNKILTNYINKDTKISSFDNTSIFEVPTTEIVKLAHDLHDNEKLSLKLITATDERKENGYYKIWYVFASPEEKCFIIPFIVLKNSEEFPALAPTMHEAWIYERRIRTFFGLKPVGHPDERAVILHENWPGDLFPLRKDFEWNNRPPVLQGDIYKFQKVEGEGIYEIPVGPIHAGIIEPGHFRFSVAGEEILLLESRLGYVHKGSEKLFEVLPVDEKIKLSEKISGDSSFSHSLAFCQSLEQLGGTVVPKRARYLRVIFSELERLANHFGDIGAMMLDTGYSFGGSNGARLREMIMQLNEKLSGNRFLRGINIIGGVTKDINDVENKNLVEYLEKINIDFNEIIAIAQNSVSLLNRLKGTGKLDKIIAINHGAVGVPAKAMGIVNDTRLDFPYAAYDEINIGNVHTEQESDAHARFFVRINEVYSSINIIKEALSKLPVGRIICNNTLCFKKNSLAISCVEGWRGEIIYFVTTNSVGEIDRVFPRDPSFVNWSVLGYAGYGNVVPDFPLINKSFNLSYSGNDL